MGPLEPTKYGEYFHDLYLNCLENRWVLHLLRFGKGI